MPNQVTSVCSFNFPQYILEDSPELVALHLPHPILSIFLIDCFWSKKHIYNKTCAASVTSPQELPLPHHFILLHLGEDFHISTNN
jgi:hypothetical protein